MSAAETVRELMRRGGEEGMAAVGLRPAVLRGVRETPAMDPEEQVKIMRETLDYLRLEPAARAKVEAEPLVTAAAAARETAERALAERERELTELRGRPTPALSAEPSDSLRAFLAESEAQLAAARVDLEAARAETGRVAAENERLRMALLQQPATPRERVVYREVELPQDVQLEPKRNAAGRVERVVMRAAGYTPVNVDMVRGPDNRIAALRLRR